MQKALLEQGVDTLMIETDSPYLTPEPHRGQKNEPAYVSEIGKKMCRTIQSRSGCIR